MRIDETLHKADYIMYLSNAGVLVKLKDKKILIDAFCSPEIPIYKSIPDEMLEHLIDNVEPFDDIDIILITHHHSDHFDSSSICWYMKQNLKTIVISTPEVISKLRQAGEAIEGNRLIELYINPGSLERIELKGLDIQVISTLHDGKEYKNINNFAYLVEYNGKSILHLGDTSPELQNFMHLELGKYKLDLLIANFPYIGIPNARKIIKEYIFPKRIAVVHLPKNDTDRFGWIKTAKKNYESIKSDFIPTIFMEDVGTTIEI